MTYRYTKTSLLLQGTLVFLFLFLAFYASSLMLRFFGGFVAVVLLKDLLHCVGAEFQLDEKGLVERSKFKERYRITWDNIEIISKTKVNRRWIMVRGSGKTYYMIKPYIQNYESLAREIIQYLKEHRIKGVVVHEDVLKRLRLDIKLNSEGLMKF